MNPDAILIPIQNGVVNPSDIFNQYLFDFEKSSQSAGWMKELNEEHIPETDEYGISSFVYKRKRPFHPERWNAWLSAFPQEIVRSKGFFWLASRPDAAGEWSQAGGIVRHGPAGIWWDAAPHEHWPADPKQRAQIEAEFDGEYGDRRQEIVFIGQHLEPRNRRLVVVVALPVTGHGVDILLVGSRDLNRVRE